MNNKNTLTSDNSSQFVHSNKQDNMGSFQKVLEISLSEIPYIYVILSLTKNEIFFCNCRKIKRKTKDSITKW